MKRQIARLAGPVLVLAVASGCVTKKVHDETLGELATARAQVEEARGEVQDLTVALKEANIRADLLGSEIAELEEQLAIATVRAEDAEGQLAEVIKDRSKLTASVDDMKAALAELKRLQLQTAARAAEYQAVLAKFKSLIATGKLEAKIVDGRLVLQLQTDILFPSGSAKLSDEGVAVIREVGTLLGEIPERRFQVEGHTDNVPIRTKAYRSNWELASARSINVVNEMIDAGMPPARISAAAFADTRPTAGNDSEEGRAKNRRIEIVIVPDLSDLPGAEQIEKMFNQS